MRSGQTQRVVSAGQCLHNRFVTQDREDAPMQAEPPEALIERIGRNQDREAFVKLFEMFAPRLKAFMLKKGVTPTEAEDLIQEVMLTVWHKAPLFDPKKAAVSTWLYTLARNKRIDRLRKDHRLEFDGKDPVLVTDPEHQADYVVNEKLSGNGVKKALKTLPEEQGKIIQLSFYEEKSHSEIAALLGIPIGTVKSRIRLAMEKMRLLLGDLR